MSANLLQGTSGRPRWPSAHAEQHARRGDSRVHVVFDFRGIRQTDLSATGKEYRLSPQCLRRCFKLGQSKQDLASRWPQCHSRANPLAPLAGDVAAKAMPSSAALSDAAATVRRSDDARAWVFNSRISGVFVNRNNLKYYAAATYAKPHRSVFFFGTVAA